MEEIIRCPECGSPVDRHDIYVDRNQIYCRKKCGGVYLEIPDLANHKLPPPKKIRKPKEVSIKEIIFKSSSHSIDVTFKRSGKGMGIFLMVIGLGFVLLGYIIALNMFDRSQPVPTLEILEPGVVIFSSFWALLGLYVILRGVWESIGGYRAALDNRDFYYGKILGKMWFRKKYRIDQVVDIRKYLQKVSDRKHYYRIGFFIEGKKKPYYPKFYSSQKEIDWLVYEFNMIFKFQSPNLDEEADFGEV